MKQLVIALAILAGACSGGDDDGPRLADPTTTTTRETTTTAKETTTTQPGAFKVGDRVETARGNFITLHAYEQPVAPREFMEPDPGQEFAAVDVEFCAVVETGVPDTPAYAVGPFDYELQMADNTRRTFDIPAKEPPLNSADVAVGDCLRGWVTYQVPVGERPTRLLALNTEPLVKFDL